LRPFLAAHCLKLNYQRPFTALQAVSRWPRPSPWFVKEPLKKSIHGLFQSASALLLVRNRAKCAPKGLAYRRLPVENKFSNTFQINALRIMALLLVGGNAATSVAPL